MKKPNLTRKDQTKKSPWALAAANIKKELKYKFPDTKFTVTSSRFAGGDAVDVRWIDGPSCKEVEKIAKKYQYGKFDGMGDIYEYKKGHDDTYGSAKYVSLHRDYSIKAIMNTARKLGIAVEVRGGFCRFKNYSEESRVYSKLSETSFNVSP